MLASFRLPLLAAAISVLSGCAMITIREAPQRASSPSTCPEHDAGVKVNQSFTSKNPPCVESLGDESRLFRRKEGWIGGDAAGSVLLGPGRVLWLFGDSLLGRVRDSSRHIESMIHNSIAIQNGPDPGSARMEFFYGWSGAEPEAFIRPEHGAGWFWLSQGSIRNGSGLYLFLPRIVKAPGPHGWNFRVQGIVLGKIRNPDERPNFWKIHQFAVPWFRRDQSGEERSFGASVLQAGPWFYIYGIAYHKSTGNRRLLVARTREASLENFGAWEFLGNGAWVRDFKKVSPQADHLGAEFSVSWLPGLHRYVLVYSEDGLSDKIIMRSAPSAGGPWSGPVMICRTSETNRDKETFCYAAKAHPALAQRDDELIISYVCNSTNLHRLTEDPGIYVPRFIKVRLRCASTMSQSLPSR